MLTLAEFLLLLKFVNSVVKNVALVFRLLYVKRITTWRRRRNSEFSAISTSIFY
jgi:hypothetical protein